MLQSTGSKKSQMYLGTEQQQQISSSGFSLAHSREASVPPFIEVDFSRILSLFCRLEAKEGKEGKRVFGVGEVLLRKEWEKVRSPHPGELEQGQRWELTAQHQAPPKAREGGQTSTGEAMLCMERWGPGAEHHIDEASTHSRRKQQKEERASQGTRTDQRSAPQTPISTRDPQDNIYILL